MAGFFITFEGIDLCGKSVQTRRLAERLESRGLAVLLIRDPGTTLISENIRAILLSVKNQGMCFETELLLFAAARAQMMHEIILPALKEGKIVLCDRFYDSTTAYQGYGRSLDLAVINMLNQFAAHHRAPDLTFLFDITPETAEKRRLASRKEKDRMETVNPDFIKRVRDGFLKIAQADPHRVLVVDGEKTVEMIAEEVWQQVQHKII
jgi:dTMP kinase